MQHLRHLGLHPSAFAGGQNDDVKVGHVLEIGRSRPELVLREQRGETSSAAESVEIGIDPCERTVLRVGLDRLCQIAYREFRVATLRVHDGEHVEGLVVGRLIHTDTVEVAGCLLEVAGIQGQGGGIQAFAIVRGVRT